MTTLALFAGFAFTAGTAAAQMQPIPNPPEKPKAASAAHHAWHHAHHARHHAHHATHHAKRHAMAGKATMDDKAPAPTSPPPK